MALTNFTSLLKRVIGLDAASIGVSAIDRAVQLRMTACGLHRQDEYSDLVRTSHAELQALIEAVVVPETWFFREAEAFAALVRFVRELCLTADRSIVRLLSLPCATGEEPYSMAMALLDAGISPARFEIDAVDVSKHALDEALLGIYRKSSFRSDDVAYRARHFEVSPGGYRVRDHVRRQVTFRHGNVLNPETLPGMGIYDIVFCRNVLIYFDGATQKRAIDVLSRLLTPTGLLFVGPAESSALLNHGLVPARIPKAHAFRTSKNVERQEDVQRRARPRAVKPTPTVRPPAAGAVRAERRPMPTTAPVPDQPQAPSRPAADWDAVTQLGDQRHFAEAAALCERYLQDHGPAAQGFYLLGLMRDAVGREADAAACYRKALYLDPHHHDALVHLALLMEATDAAAEAHRLRTRARRVAQQDGRS